MNRTRLPGSPEPAVTEGERRPGARSRPHDSAGQRPRPLISLIIPVHNIADYLGQCLDSITRQEFQDFEIIAVDGASDDASGKMLDERSGEEPRLTVLHKERIGPGLARNVGAQQAEGEYLWFVDGDDLLPDGSLAAIASRIDASRPDLLFVDHEALYPDGTTELSNDHQLLARKTADCFTVADQPWTLQLRMAPWNKVIRRDFFTAMSAAFLSAWPHEDIPVSCLLLLAARRLSILDQICYRYRKDRRGSAITSASLRRHFTIFKSYQAIMTRVDELVRSNDLVLTEDVRRALFERVIWHYTNILDEGRMRVRTAASATAGAGMRDRREFFARMHEDFIRYAPPGYRPSGSARSLKLLLVRLNAYWIYAAMQPLNQLRVKASQSVRAGRTD